MSQVAPRVKGMKITFVVMRLHQHPLICLIFVPPKVALRLKCALRASLGVKLA
ncbi:MAG: hypothetical protein OSA51_08015 [Octadecabacter sp.]|nr:hypothetical protein [Octadecabacter sp.]